MVSLAQLKQWAHKVKRDVVAVYFAARHPETPTWLRLLAWAVAAYALSPTDLIPDFIPILGYLDDLIIIPIGLIVVIRLLPPHVLSDSRAKASKVLANPRSLTAAALFVVIWMLCGVGLVYWLVR
jgi:uncharacterized membrane protein YkvA (DUF1232 family)